MYAYHAALWFTLHSSNESRYTYAYQWPIVLFSPTQTPLTKQQCLGACALELEVNYTHKNLNVFYFNQSSKVVSGCGLTIFVET
jgi:hypothetical protein